MKWDFEGNYMDQFPASYKGTIGDRFCRAVRAGAKDSASVLVWVINDLNGNPNPVWQQVRGTCQTGDAMKFAEHILKRESLTFEEKEELKAGSAFRQPTEKQLKYLKSLGVETEPKTREEAGELIDKALNGRKAFPLVKRPSDTPFD